MKLLYLSADNLRNGPFIKDLVYNYKKVGKSIILHDHFGKVADTRFVTKRISALMSEEMILNNAFSGDQRQIIATTADALSLRMDFLQQSLQTVDLIILNALGLADGALATLDPLRVLDALRLALDVEEVYVFPKNARSPLVSQPRLLRAAAEIEPLRPVYEEEAAVLGLAERLLPVVLAAPGNFLTATT
jgi:hypothetical protein